MQTLRRLGHYSTAALLLLALSACNSGDDTNPELWQIDWQTLNSVVPDQSELGDPPDQDICRSTLADIRAQKQELPAAPTERIDQFANEWVAIAEEAFFECPPVGPDIDSFADAYDELRRLDDAIQAALDET